MHGCSSRVTGEDSVAYVYCFTIDDEVTLPKPLGEKLPLKYYAGKVRDFRRVWNRTLHAVFHLPEDIVPGVYKYRGAETYYFAVLPGLPICIKVEGFEEVEDVSILTLVKIYINGEEVKYRDLPGIIYETTMKHPQCFDVVYMAFANLAKGNLEEETYKPLMNIKGETEVTYVVEMYVDKPLLNKNATIHVSIGPPYIAIQQK